ncbi:MAG TPA: hypothetical protein DHV62_04580, partial [Elusimicrobia bacterium]|nr:hypothetical protein [Elusimicrobiota bacterium]
PYTLHFTPYTTVVEGVQFHPESILTKEGKKLLGNFLNLSRKEA